MSRSRRSDRWPHSPAGLALGEHEVHVWRAALDLPAAECRRLELTLSEEERSRAERFRFPLHRQRFIAARGILRDILARYLEREAIHLAFQYGSHGKPALAGETPSGIRFNLAHSEAMALFAFARGREVGVDVEQLRAIPDAEAIAGRFFSAPEQAVLRAASRERREEAFFACWTRKEALVKAVGKGLSIPLHGFDSTGSVGEPARLLDSCGVLVEGTNWTLQQLHPGHNYVGALAVAGSGCSIHLLEWSSRLRLRRGEPAR